MKNNTTSSHKVNDEIDLVLLLKTLIKGWRWYVVIVPICMVVALVAILSMPPKYASHTSVLVRSDDASANSLSNLNLGLSSNLFPQSAVNENELEIMQSYTSLVKLVEELDLNQNIYVKDGLKWKETYHEAPIQMQFSAEKLKNLKASLLVKVQKEKHEWIVKVKLSHGFMDSETFKKVVKDINGPMTFDFGVLYFQEVKENIDPEDPYYTVKIDMASTASRVEDYKKNITVEFTSEGSNVMQITDQRSSRYKSRAILNKMVDLYFRDILNDKNRTSIQMDKFIRERIAVLTTDLDTVEDKIEAFRSENNMVDVVEQSRIMLESVEEYDKKLAAIEVNLSLIEFIHDHLQKAERYVLMPENVGVNQEALGELIQSYNKEVLRYQGLIYSTNASNPVLEQVKETLKMMRANLLQSLNNESATLTLKKNELLARNISLEQEVKNVPTLQKEYFKVSREQSIKRQLYLFLLQRREETEMSLASNTLASRVIDAAYTDYKPYSPSKMRYMLFAIIFGGLLASVIVFFKTFYNSKIVSKDDLKRLSNFPIVGMIPQIKNAKDKTVMINDGVDTVFAERMRLVRSNLRFILKKPEDKVVLITSSISGEGKSFFSVNFAQSLALNHKKVVIVGLDLRRPTIGAYLHLQSNFGVSDFIYNTQTTVDEVIRPSEFNPLVDVIVSGTIPPNPSELLSDPRLEVLITELRARYDYVILDSAPIIPVSDTFMLTERIDCTLCLCRVGYTPKEFIITVNEKAEKGYLKNLSFVINNVNISDIKSYKYTYQAH